MERLVLAAVLVVVAVAAAAVLGRRRGDGPTQTSWAVPSQLDPADLGPVTTPWVAVTFTSATCDSCAAVRSRAAALADDGRVGLIDLEVGERPDLHRRYGIDAVPTLVLVDPTGLVRASVVGPLDDDDFDELRALCVTDPGPPHIDEGTPVDLP